MKLIQKIQKTQQKFMWIEIKNIIEKYKSRFLNI